MTRKIKFRAQSLYGTEEFVYGYYLPYKETITKGEHYMLKILHKDKMLIMDEEGVCHHVKPDTVRQFVGYDCDGKEIYEGDYLINEEYDIEGQAELQSIISGEFSDRLFDKNGQNKDFRKDKD